MHQELKIEIQEKSVFPVISTQFKNEEHFLGKKNIQISRLSFGLTQSNFAFMTQNSNRLPNDKLALKSYDQNSNRVCQNGQMKD